VKTSRHRRYEVRLGLVGAYLDQKKIVDAGQCLGCRRTKAGAKRKLRQVRDELIGSPYGAVVLIRDTKRGCYVQ
jgi:hypothetical protein